MRDGRVLWVSLGAQVPNGLVHAEHAKVAFSLPLLSEETIHAPQILPMGRETE